MVRKRPQKPILVPTLLVSVSEKKWSVGRVSVNEWKCEKTKQNKQQQKTTATEVYSEREREQNLVYMMSWNRKDFKNKICKA